MNVILVLFLAIAPLTGAAVELVKAAPQAVLGNGPRSIEFALRNSALTNAQLAVGYQLFQASSTLAAPWQTVPRRELTILSNQTIVQALEIPWPKVAAPSRFILRVLDRELILGNVDVWVYPENLLTNSLSLFRSWSFDSTRPDLQQVLETAAALLKRTNENFDPQLPEVAVYGPEFPPGTRRARIAEALALCRSGAGVVLISIDYDESRLPAPSFYFARVGKGVLVRVRDEALANVKNDPRAQMRLASILRLASGLSPLKSSECELIL